MFIGDVRVLECWCGRICVVRKSNTLTNLERHFYTCPLSKVCLTILVWRMVWSTPYWLCTGWCWKLWIFYLCWWSWRTKLLLKTMELVLVVEETIKFVYLIILRNYAHHGKQWLDNVFTSWLQFMGRMQQRFLKWGSKHYLFKNIGDQRCI